MQIDSTHPEVLLQGYLNHHLSSFLEHSNFLGETYSSHPSSSQEDSQKRVVAPSPMVKVMAVAKRTLSALVHWFPKPIQGFDGSVHWNHSHLTLRAKVNFYKFRILGFQEIWACTPAPSSLYTCRLTPCRSLPKYRHVSGYRFSSTP